MLADDLLRSEFVPMDRLIRARAREAGETLAISDDRQRMTWQEVDRLTDRIASRLQSEGVGKGNSVAIAAQNSVDYALVLFAILRCGAVAALLTASANGESLVRMFGDCGADHLFVDGDAAGKLGATGMAQDCRQIQIGNDAGKDGLADWMAPAGSVPEPVEIRPEDSFCIIYSSGTTGDPKGIVQSHAMRMAYLRRAEWAGYDRSAITFISTPLYSNTTLVGFLPAIAGGGHVILMPRFDARLFCEIAERERVTHATLVPVQFQRIMALPEFDSYDLSAFRYKSSTSAPFSAELKEEVLRRWPGRLVEFYGMTEGGASCILEAGEHRDKLHTVGQPAEGHDMRLIDGQGREVPRGEVGEVVGRSGLMMAGYHGQPGKTRETEWYDSEGQRFIRHGDLGRFDEDGFLMLIGRTKDMIISGGFNIYPADLEAELMKHPSVIEAAVVGAPSEQWGETPVGFVVLRDRQADLTAILEDANSRLGKTQRIARLHVMDVLPRNAIGKVLKRELKE